MYINQERLVATSTPNFTGSTSARVIEPNSLNFNPTYSFSRQYHCERNISVALDAMETIKVVPNPYYGYYSYEINQLDNRVKYLRKSFSKAIYS